MSTWIVHSSWRRSETYKGLSENAGAYLVLKMVPSHPCCHFIVQRQSHGHVKDPWRRCIPSLEARDGERTKYMLTTYLSQAMSGIVSGTK